MLLSSCDTQEPKRRATSCTLRCQQQQIKQQHDNPVQRKLQPYIQPDHSQVKRVNLRVLHVGTRMSMVSMRDCHKVWRIEF